MGIRQLDICNRVMAQAQGIAESDFPIDAFPAKVQSVILNMVRHENFKVEYLATAMLSAAASALGNTYNIRVKGQWTTNAVLYIIMVGRPGLGKTPPLEAVFRPLRKRDCRALEKFKAEMAAYQNTMKESKGNNDMDRPVLRRTIVSDFTPEALMLAHHNCPRGITILADEIMGMFNSANRYNNGQLIEQLLSAWSNSAIDVTRVSNPIPIHIENPCINMIGTTGEYSFVKADVKQWADWGIDYLKYDWSPNDRYYTEEMYEALRACGRDIVYSISNNAPYADAPMWKELCQCWRTTGDIRDTWKSMSSIGFAHERWLAFTGPGHWADPDMLVVGMVGWGPKLHRTNLTADEQYTHISLWSLLAAPLLIGCPIDKLDDFTLSLLTNDEVIDVNQDPLGLQAAPIWRDGNSKVIYVKHLEDGSVAVGLFNRGEKPAEMKFTLRQLGMRGTKTIRDLWRQQDIATLELGETYTAEVAPHGVVLLKVGPGNPTERRVGKVER